MVCRCENRDYNKFIAGVFQECVSGTTGVVSFIFGWISICCWIVSFLPQIRMTFLMKRSEALSAAFIMCLVMGDLFNLISCFLLNQLFTQQILSIIFVSFDAIFIFQHFYYLRPCNQTESKSITFKVSESLLYGFIVVLIINNVLWSGFHNQFGLKLQETVYDICKTPKELSTKSAQYIIGNVMAYGSLPMYLASRPGQIIKNHKRKSAIGLSVGMFSTTAAANIAQLISLFSMSQERQYLIQKIPYVLGCSLPAICDIIIVIQWFMFSKIDKIRNCKSQPSEEKFAICQLSNETTESTVGISTAITSDLIK
ncbi:Seven_transmembrane protein 1 [Hexamita inflata]|uniref:Seven transmembrane protein 1 n=1 Tax=Hexamita inflata TaxID=28002 RepID=A0AA86VRC1_9EUKA|nr:Seven transmembrane protein 1 [Hexamita inflata]